MSSYVITKLIKQAELSKAKLLRPSGEQYDYSRDDDFYHFMAHIDKGLQEKIRKGEFIELNKLLVRRKPILNQESRLDIVNRSGRSFLVPNNERELLSINSFKRWEKPFIYTQVYTQWLIHTMQMRFQYVDTIANVASTFTWENVYSYVILFRHLMAFSPNRSWAIIYQHRWSIILKDHLTKSPMKNNRRNFKSDRVKE